MLKQFIEMLRFYFRLLLACERIGPHVFKRHLKTVNVKSKKAAFEWEAQTLKPAHRLQGNSIHSKNY